MTTNESFTPAGTLKPGDTVCESDGFMTRVVRTQRTASQRCVCVTLVPVYGSMTWPEGQERTFTLGVNRMVLVA